MVRIVVDAISPGLSIGGSGVLVGISVGPVPIVGSGDGIGVIVGDIVGDTSGVTDIVTEGSGEILGVSVGVEITVVGVGLGVKVGVALGVAVCAIWDPEGKIEKFLEITTLTPASF